MAGAIELIVGLGNPGADYDKTRHNAGAWVVDALANSAPVSLRPEKKFHGLYAKIHLENYPVHLLMPTTFMNHSGQAVRALCDFYKIPANNILVAHDELDLPAGTARLKTGGGHGGHNGLRDIINHLSSRDFHRLRIGIAHPGDKHRVLDYVLGRPSNADKQQIENAIADSIRVLPDCLNGNINQAMKTLHTA